MADGSCMRRMTIVLTGSLHLTVDNEHSEFQTCEQAKIQCIENRYLSKNEYTAPCNAIKLSYEMFSYVPIPVV